MESPPPRPAPERANSNGPWGGPTYGHKAARIGWAPGGHICGLSMEAHPLHGLTIGAVGTVTPLLDLWLNEGRLPANMRAVPKG